jgi:hypothetical protein
MENIATYHLYLSSAYRTSGTSSNYTINLGKPIQLQNPNNRFSLRVGSAEIPYVFKLLNSNNNVISYTVIRGSTYNGTFVIAPGNYTILSLLTEFKTKLFASINTLTGFDGTALASFVYNRATGKVALTVVGIDSIVTTITISANSPVFLRCLGFSNVFTFGYSTPSVRTTAESTQNVNVSQNTSVYIRSDTLSQSHSYEAIIGPNSLTDVIAKVPINSQPQSYLLWTNMVDLENEINNRLIDSINLYLGDAQTSELDLGGLDWTCRLTIKEWAMTGRESDDMAKNMGGATMLPELYNQRQKAIEKLKRLRDKISPPVVEDAPKG